MKEATKKYLSISISSIPKKHTRYAHHYQNIEEAMTFINVNNCEIITTCVDACGGVVGFVVACEEMVLNDY